MKLETRLAQSGSRWDAVTGSVAMPIYQVATFRHPSLGASTGFDYSRTGNPTRQVLEEAIAASEGGGRAFAFSSGLAAIDAVLHLLPPGSRFLITEDMYGGTWRLLDRVHSSRGIEPVLVDTSDTAAVEAALAKGAAGILVESPSNPLLKIADLRAIAALAAARQALLVVDNTFLTPVLQRPLDLGADVTVYSATKFLAGHNDVLAGAAVTRRPDLAERLQKLLATTGAPLSPFDSWLTLRGIKTLPLRIRRQEETAHKIAGWLATHPRVSNVHYPGLPGHPGRERQLGQARGFGSMISFEVDDATLVPAFLASLRVWLFAESLGGVESLATFPFAQTHGDIPLEERRRLGISDRLLRLSVGIEDADDLIEDLDRALVRPYSATALDGDTWSYTI